MNIETSLEALYNKSRYGLMAYGDKVGGVISENLQTAKFLDIGFIKKTWINKSEFGIEIKAGKSQKFCVPQGIIAPIWQNDILIGLYTINSSILSYDINPGITNSV